MLFGQLVHYSHADVPVQVARFLFTDLCLVKDFSFVQHCIRECNEIPLPRISNRIRESSSSFTELNSDELIGMDELYSLQPENYKTMFQRAIVFFDLCRLFVFPFFRNKLHKLVVIS